MNVDAPAFYPKQHQQEQTKYISQNFSDRGRARNKGRGATKYSFARHTALTQTENVQQHIVNDRRGSSYRGRGGRGVPQQKEPYNTSMRELMIESTMAISAQNNMSAYCELPDEIIMHIMSFTEPITLTASYFSHSPSTSSLAQFWYGRLSHSNSIVCLFPLVQIAFQMESISVWNGKYETIYYESEMKDASLDLHAWLPSSAIRYLDVACWTINNSIYTPSLCYFTNLDEFRMSKYHCTNKRFAYCDRPSWSATNFLKAQKNMQKLTMSSVVLHDVDNELFHSFPTTLTHLNLEKLTSEKYTLYHVSELVKSLPNLQSLNVTLEGSGELDLSFAKQLEHLTIGTSEFLGVMYDIKFNAGLKSLTTFDDVMLSKASAINLFNLEHFKQLILVRSVSDNEYNTIMKKIPIDNIALWSDVMNSLERRDTLEHFMVSCTEKVTRTHNNESKQEPKKKYRRPKRQSRQLETPQADQVLVTQTKKRSTKQQWSDFFNRK
jgi:hypothetical protein